MSSKVAIAPVKEVVAPSKEAVPAKEAPKKPAKVKKPLSEKQLAIKKKLKDMKINKKKKRLAKREAKAKASKAEEKVESVAVKNKYIGEIGLGGKKTVPTELDRKVCEALFDIELQNEELKGTLQTLGILKTKLLRVSPHRKGLVVFVKKAELEKFQKVYEKLIALLEKKFVNTHVMIVSKRKALKEITPQRKRSQTVKHVKDMLMEELCFPLEMQQKRTLIKQSGEVNIIFVNPKDKATAFGAKLHTFSKCCSQLLHRKTKYVFTRLF